MRLLQLQFGGILDRHDAFAMVDEGGQGIEQRGLAGARAAGNQDIAAAFDDRLQQLRHFLADAAILDQLAM